VADAVLPYASLRCGGAGLSARSALGLGTHTAWAFLSAIWLYWCWALSVHCSWALERGGSIRHISASRLDCAFSIRYGNLFYNPFICCRSPFLYGSTLLFAMHGATILAVSRFGVNARSNRFLTEEPLRACGAVLALDNGFNATMESIHRWRGGSRCLPVERRHRHFANRHGRRQLVSMGVHHGIAPDYPSLCAGGRSAPATELSNESRSSPWERTRNSPYCGDVLTAGWGRHLIANRTYRVGEDQIATGAAQRILQAANALPDAIDKASQSAKGRQPFTRT